MFLIGKIGKSKLSDFKDSKLGGYKTSKVGTHIKSFSLSTKKTTPYFGKSAFILTTIFSTD